MAKRTAAIGIPDPTFTYEEFKRELGKRLKGDELLEVSLVNVVEDNGNVSGEINSGKSEKYAEQNSVQERSDKRKEVVKFLFKRKTETRPNFNKNLNHEAQSLKQSDSSSKEI